jgi:predicted solute-binding protein
MWLKPTPLTYTTNTTPSFKVKVAACDLRLLIGNTALKGKGSSGEKIVVGL